MREKIVASWSSGKDCAIALECALEGGFEGVASVVSRVLEDSGHSIEFAISTLSALFFLLAAALFRLICGSSGLCLLTLLHNAHGDNIDLFDLLRGEECG